MSVQTTPSVRKQVTVGLPPAEAFELFTRGMGTWWPHSYHIGEQDAEAVIEPHAGGRWFEHGGGGECQWGRVLAYEPPHRLLLAWQLDSDWRYDPDFTTEVEIRFIAEGENATRVELEHRDMDRFDAGVRASFDGEDGWSGILSAYGEGLLA